MFQRIIDNPNKSTLLFLTLLVVTVFLVYYPSLMVPFYLDDRESILTNVSVHSPTLDLLVNGPNRMRIIGYFTLWLNYQIGGIEPFGYHLVNILLHAVNSLLVYVLARQLFCHFSPKANSSVEQREQNTRNGLWALAIAAIWALHPLNSQAVTYVVQRLASIVTIFYLLTIIFYIQARKQTKPAKIGIYALLVIGCIVAGLHAKQNFVGVILFLLVWELLTSSTKVRNVLLWLMAGITVAVLVVAPFIPLFWQTLDSFTRDFSAAGRPEYFYSQMIVLWDYALRFIYPFSLQLNIDTDLKKTMEPVVGLALFAHVMVLVIGYKYRKTLPLLLVGILVFYTGHAVESFIIPIKDLAFEHRTYISNIGLMIALVAMVRYWCDKSPTRSGRWLVASVCVVLAIACITTVKRNILWQDPLAFYANEVKSAPEHPRANASYGNELMKLKRFAEAEVYLKKGVDFNIAKGKITASSLIAFMTVLYEQEKYQQASHIAMLGLRHVKRPLDRSNLLSNLAYGYIKMGYCDFAKGLLKTALKLNPNNDDAKTNLAYCAGGQRGG
ncbi:MAG: tetratricopeptide repeat protein [Psychrosphaera sp.]|nr:tetratricopeptide repeat protein [Psychrosphaera sp.]